MTVMTRSQKIRSLASKLPQEIIHDIISRLPVKDLFRFRCASKSWLYLLSLDPNFKKLHQINNTGKPNYNPGIIALTSKPTKLYYASDYTACDKAIKFDLPPFRKPYAPVHVYDHYQLYAICNGLLCMSYSCFNSNENFSNVYLWNPLTSDHIIIPCPPVIPPVADHPINHEASFGLGYDECSNEYKIVRLVWCPHKDMAGATNYVNASVYNLGTNTWKFLKVIPYDFISYNTRLPRIPLVNGALHWLADKKQLHSLAMIFSFDIKTEVFHEIPLPDNVRHDKVVLGELDGSLSVFCNHHKTVQIWIMEEYGVGDSWRKQCVIQHSNLNHLSGVIGLASNQDIIIKSGNGVLRNMSLLFSLITGASPHSGLPMRMESAT